MTTDEFRSYAIQSARIYYRHLDEQGKGVIKTAVRSIRREGAFFVVHLQTKLSPSADPASLLFDFDGQRYSSFEIRPIELSHTRDQLWVRPADALTERFSQLKAEELTLLSDLKFLVKNVEAWYETYGDRICLHAAPPSVTPVYLSQADSLSQEQRAAIDGALSHTLSYVWGAPGTGKTRCVLANCVLSYLLSTPDGKVLLLAPTNNAVEQMLYGTLPALAAQGIPLDTVLRLGTPSARFSSEYPSVCEVANANHTLSALQEKRDLLQKCLTFRQYAASFSAAMETIPSCVEAIFSRKEQIRQWETDREALRLDSAVSRGKLTLVQEEICRLLDVVAKRRERNTHSITLRLKKRIFPTPAQKERQLLQEEEAALQMQVANAEQLETTVQEAQRSAALLASQTETARAEIEDFRGKILTCCAFWPSLRAAALQADFSDKSTCLTYFHDIFSRFQEQLQARGGPYVALESLDDETIRQQITTCVQQISEAEQDTTPARLGAVRVLAATIDRFLSSASPNGFGSFVPDHIFMDEAGYAALIKTAPIFSMQVPVTLIGDHMQLPPVCEMDDQLFSRDDLAPAFLWSQSALHGESIFTDGFHQMLERYQHAGPPAFLLMEKFDLTATYRFGDALADILASYVYSSLFHSAIGSGTDLYYLDAPGSPGETNRTRPSEVRAIQDALRRLDHLDYAVLSPYRNQVSLLSAALPQARKEDRVLTVHASQGREWDILFFSVVDTDRKWFTDTVRSLTQGKMVVNTALSRARRAVILVCDVFYWSGHTDQLIGQLCKNSSSLLSSPFYRDRAFPANQDEPGGEPHAPGTVR